MYENIKVLNEVVNTEIQQKLERYFCQLPWFLGPEFQQDGTVLESPTVVSNLIFHYKNKRKLSDVYDVIAPLCFKIVDLSEFKFREFLQIRASVQFPVAEDRIINYIHTDLDDAIGDFYTSVYYINDCPQASTVIYQQKRIDLRQEVLDADDLDEAKRVDPKRGRATIFPGVLYHAGMLPKTQAKMVLNLSWR